MARSNESLMREFAEKKFVAELTNLKNQINKSKSALSEKYNNNYDDLVTKIEEKYENLDKDFQIASLKAELRELNSLIYKNEEGEKKEDSNSRASSIKPLTDYELQNLRNKYLSPIWGCIDGNIPSSWLPEFVNNTRRLLSQNQLKVKDLAKYLNISSATVSGFLQPDSPNPPRINYVISIANLFNVSIDYLVGRIPLPNEYCPSSNTDFRAKYGLTEKALKSFEEILMYLEGNQTIFPNMRPHDLLRLLYESNSFKRTIYHLARYLDAVATGDLTINMKDSDIDKIYYFRRKHEAERFYEKKRHLYTEYAQAYRYFNDIINEVQSSDALASFLPFSLVEHDKKSFSPPSPIDFADDDYLDNLLFTSPSSDKTTEENLFTTFNVTLRQKLTGLLAFEKDSYKIIAIYRDTSYAQGALNECIKEFPKQKFNLMGIQTVDQTSEINSLSELLRQFTLALVSYDRNNYTVIGLFSKPEDLSSATNTYRFLYPSHTVIQVALNYDDENKLDTASILEIYEPISSGDKDL